MGQHQDNHDLPDERRRRDEVRTALAAIGSEALRDPAGPDDHRFRSTWRAALAVVGLDLLMQRDGTALPDSISQTWSREDVREHLQHLTPAVRERATRALSLIELFEHRSAQTQGCGALAKMVSVHDFMVTIGLCKPKVAVLVTTRIPVVVPRMQGLDEIQTALQPERSSESDNDLDEKREMPDPQRRLARLRALGGDVKWSWHGARITGICKLCEAEVADGRKRTSEKTIRIDLLEAARAESEAKRRGEKPPSPFPS